MSKIQIVEKIFKDEYKMSAIDKELLKAQWVSMKETLIKQIEEAMKDGSAEEAHVTATTTSVEEMEVVEVEKKRSFMSSLKTNTLKVLILKKIW